MPAARTIRNLSWLLPLAVLAGCGGGAAFSPDGLLLAEARVVAEHRGQLDGVLNTLFGTPDEPAVPAALAEVLDIEQIRHAAGPVESHRVGETIGLYRRHCARCHGLTGDGQGPTALYQSPYPRDFRAGVFKWKSTTRGAAPLDEDLHATLERGIPGTAMPSFRLLKQEERDALVEYVKYLAIRGQTERRLIEHVAEELDYDPDAGTAEPGSELSLTSDGDRQMLDEWFGTLSQRWGKARETAVSPASMSIATHAGGDSPELIAAGEALFHDVQRANCVKCHGPAGTGGVPLRDMDDWNKRRQGFVDATELLAAAAETRRAAAQSAPPAYRQQSFAQLRPLEQQVDERRGVAAAFLPPVTARPRRIAGGVLRGGGDRLAVAIHEGIAGTPMPGIGATSSPQDVAALAAYVRFLLQRDQSEGAL